MKINQLKDDLDYCERLIQENSSSFYRAFRTLEGEKAQAVFAIYAFCRLADDAIDEEKNPEIVRTMQRQLQAFAAGQVPDEPMWRALAWAFKRFNLDLSPFEDMLRGQLKDVDFKQAEMLANLLDYCYLVAGSVGLMLNPILSGDQSGQLEDASIELGEAMQLTNILRDIGIDYKMKRIYLPRQLMEAYQVAEKDLVGPKASANLIKLWEALATEAEQRYDHVETKLPLYDQDARLPLLLSIRYYKGILVECRESGYQMLARRIYVSDYKKAKMLLTIKQELKVKNLKNHKKVEEA